MTAAGFRKLLIDAAQQATRLGPNGEVNSPSIQNAIFLGVLEGRLAYDPQILAALHPVGRPVSAVAPQGS